MQISDIVNREVVNLTNCEHEPIHIPGSIQPHGFLLAVTIPEYIIQFCSGNAADFTQFSYQQLLGQPLAILLGGGQLDVLTTYISQIHSAYVAPLPLTIAGQPFTCSVQQQEKVLILEFEPVANKAGNIFDIYQQTRQFTQYMEHAETLQQLCQSVADETRKLTAYDRVMIYRFDKEYNGEVYAESREENLEPFLGLHYPHTDIPVQARQLYIKNLLRLIVDVNYKPVPIYTINGGDNSSLDLGLSGLRSVSPIHVQYLQNMGVGATLTISLLLDGQLWGLIACHHYSPKYISSHTRIAAQLQGHFLTSQIRIRQQAEEYAVAREVNGSLSVLLSRLQASSELSFEDIVKMPGLLQLAHASGVVIIVNEKIYSNGKLPALETITSIARSLHQISSGHAFFTSRLVDHLPETVNCEDVSGLIYHPLTSGEGDCIIWCRPQGLQEVHWAGDPNKAIVKDKNGLSPRKSFELWKEVKQCESTPWQKPEQDAAYNFAHALDKFVHVVFLREEELKQRLLTEKLKEANAELENINWIGSHDLKEPLRKIQMFASRILDNEDIQDPQQVIRTVEGMRASARRMQLLITSMMEYSKLGHMEQGNVNCDLNELLSQVMQEMDEEIKEQKAVITYDQLPAVHGVPFLIKQLLLNLLRNALKFAKKDVPPQVTISVEPTEELPQPLVTGRTYHHITVTDNGIGFDNQHKEEIFKVFKRLHSSESYAGTGIGLAVCRKIMVNLGGYILAEAVPGRGAKFSLYFPVDF